MVTPPTLCWEALAADLRAQPLGASLIWPLAAPPAALLRAVSLPSPRWGQTVVVLEQARPGSCVGLWAPGSDCWPAGSASIHSASPTH